MDQNKRIDIDDLPKPAEQLTNDEAKSVQGGTKTGQGDVILSGPSSIAGNTVGGTLGSARGNTIGGSLAGDVSNPVKP